MLIIANKHSVPPCNENISEIPLYTDCTPKNQQIRYEAFANAENVNISIINGYFNSMLDDEALLKTLFPQADLTPRTETSGAYLTVAIEYVMERLKNPMVREQLAANAALSLFITENDDVEEKNGFIYCLKVTASWNHDSFEGVEPRELLDFKSHNINKNIKNETRDLKRKNKKLLAKVVELRAVRRSRKKRPRLGPLPRGTVYSSR